MRMHRIAVGVLAGAVAVAGGFLAGAAQPQEEMTPEQMKAYFEELAAPAPEHRWFEPLIGEFEARAVFWMDPEAPAMESRGAAKYSWVLGGRFVRMDYQGDFMGDRFTGVGFLGYDKLSKQLQSVWMDDMSTAIVFMQGYGERDGKRMTWTGSMIDPMSGQKMHVREVVTIDSPDQHTLEWFHRYDGTETELRTMKIVYTRK